jgi:putative aldouronate transport system substrate-binding protein
MPRPYEQIAVVMTWDVATVPDALIILCKQRKRKETQRARQWSQRQAAQLRRTLNKTHILLPSLRPVPPNPFLWSVLILCALMALSGCYKRAPKSLDHERVDPAAADDPAQTLTISWLGMPRFVGGRSGSWVQQQLEDRFNVRVRPIFLDFNAYRTRKPLMLLGGNVPDVYWGGAPVNIRVDVRHGFALEVPYEVIATHAPDYVALLNRYAPEAWLTTYYDGRNYGLPLFAYIARYPTPPIWRADWLENVGIERIPETLDEFREALWRFRHMDPNRSGRQDTYGISPNPPQAAQSLAEFFGAHGAFPLSWVEVDGEIRWGGVTEPARRALAMLRDWFADGLIDPDYVVTNHLPGVIQRKFTSGQVGYMLSAVSRRGLDESNRGSLANLTRQLSPGSRVVPGHFPIGPDGSRKVFVASPAQSALLFGHHLHETPDKVIRVLRIMNELARDPAFFMAARLGKRGLHWDWDEERGLVQLPPYDVKSATMPELLGTDTNISNSWGFFSPFGAPPSLIDCYMIAADRAFRDRYQRPEWGQPDVLGAGDLVPSAGRYLASLRQLQAVTYSQIIRGERPLTAFDAFVQQWYAQGGDVLTREANELGRVKSVIIQRVKAIATQKD